MDLIEPHLPDVVPLFRALHTYHATLEPDVFHCDGTDADFLALLEEKCAAGGRIFAHDAGWGLVSYVLAWPDVVDRDALRCGRREIRVDHLYVAPSMRGLGLGKELINAVEDWAREARFVGWRVGYHVANPGADDIYAALGAEPTVVFSVKRVD